MDKENLLVATIAIAIVSVESMTTFLVFFDGHFPIGSHASGLVVKWKIQVQLEEILFLS